MKWRIYLARLRYALHQADPRVVTWFVLTAAFVLWALRAAGAR